MLKSRRPILSAEIGNRREFDTQGKNTAHPQINFEIVGLTAANRMEKWQAKSAALEFSVADVERNFRCYSL
jgi:hypothetical protein